MTKTPTKTIDANNHVDHLHIMEKLNEVEYLANDPNNWITDEELWERIDKIKQTLLTGTK